MMKYRLTASVLLLAVVLSGCTTSPLPAASPSAPAATPAPDEPPATPSAPASPIISTAGFGDLLVGEPVPASQPYVEWNPDWCAEGLGAWVATSKYDSLALGTEGAEKDAPIGFLFFRGDAFATDRDIRVGSTVDELVAAYPNPDQVDAGGPTTVYSFADAAGIVSFEVAKDVEEFEDDNTANTVLAIGVLPAGAIATPIWGTDAGGGC